MTTRTKVPAPVPNGPVAGLRAYEGVEGHSRFGAGVKRQTRLDWNESARPPSPVVLERLRRVLDSQGLNWYADPSASELRRRLALYTGRPASQVLVFNGSDSALDVIARTFVGAGDHVVLAAPCYDNFRVFVEALGARVDQVLGPSPFAADAHSLVRHIGPATRLVYVCNPNNPTGRVFRRGQIEALLEALTGGVLIVDEAYFEYAGVSMAGLLDRYGHLVITRSFSKAFALAGVRCGYALAGPAVAQYVNRLRNGKEVNAVAQAAAIAALDDLAYMRAHVAEVRRARAWLVKTLRSRGFQVVRTPANFVLLETDAPERLVARLSARGIYIRDRSSLPQLERYVRVTIGTMEDCRRFVTALEGVHPRARRGRPRS